MGTSSNLLEVNHRKGCNHVEASSSLWGASCRNRCNGEVASGNSLGASCRKVCGHAGVSPSLLEASSEGEGALHIVGAGYVSVDQGFQGLEI